MIRRLPVLAALVLVSSAMAQFRTTAPSRFGSTSGFGSVLYPGTGHAPNVRMPGNISDPTFAGRFGATIRGYPPYRGITGGMQHPSHGRQVIVPVPVIVGGGYYGYDAVPPGYYQQPVAVPVPQQPVTPPVVIINQSYRPETASPVLREYSDEDLPAPTVRRYEAPVHPMPDPNENKEAQRPARRARVEDEKPTIYLIAFKDQTILPALAYWVEGDTLNYISTAGTPNRASLTLIDRDFSKQLNRERQLEFSLP